MLITQKIIAWFFPHTCILCHYPTGINRDLCEACFLALPIIPQGNAGCANIYTDASFALFSYESPLTKLIMDLKFQQRLINAQILGELMAEAIQNHWYKNKTLPSLILPVPLHAKRLRERGYNQALELSRPIARALKIPIDVKSCLRIKQTEAQATLAADERAQNMKNAFRIQRDLTGHHVAILDDVTTTGQTLMEFSQTVKEAGASQIDIWCCAKTLKS